MRRHASSFDKPFAVCSANTLFKASVISPESTGVIGKLGCSWTNVHCCGSFDALAACAESDTGS